MLYTVRTSGVGFAAAGDGIGSRPPASCHRTAALERDGQYVQTTQADLLKAIVDSRNRDAWGAFYRIYAPMISRFAQRMSLPESEADDVSQEVLIIAQRSLQGGQYDPGKGRFRSWLYGIARNRALMALRARQRPTRAQSAMMDDNVDLLSGLEDKGDEAAQEIWEQEWRYALLDEALRQLQPRLGANTLKAFELYAVQRQPVDQVAAELGITSSSVYAYKNRVLNAIRQWLEEFEESADGAAGAGRR
jgi:RNA polymerase sigma-70 factor (ECF subfamily)